MTKAELLDAMREYQAPFKDMEEEDVDMLLDPAESFYMTEKRTVGRRKVEHTVVVPLVKRTDGAAVPNEVGKVVKARFKIRDAKGKGAAAEDDEDEDEEEDFDFDQLSEAEQDKFSTYYGRIVLGFNDFPGVFLVQYVDTTLELVTLDKNEQPKFYCVLQRQYRPENVVMQPKLYK